MSLDPNKFLQYAHDYVDKCLDCTWLASYEHANQSAEYGVNWYDWLNTHDREVKEEFIKHFDEERFKKYLRERRENLIAQLQEVEATMADIGLPTKVDLSSVIENMSEEEYEALWQRSRQCKDPGDEQNEQNEKPQKDL